MNPGFFCRLGTRGSRLALWQTDQVRQGLLRARPEANIRVVPIQTTGDRFRDRPLGQIGDKGLFTRELERALLEGRIDLAVHSLKDVPVERPAGLMLGAILPRGPVGDAFVSTRWRRLEELPRGARLGTSSLRRRAQLLAWRPDLLIEDLRGNVETRLRRIAERGLDGAILACAGLERLGWADRIAQEIPLEIMLPAVGQGAIAVELRSEDAERAAWLAALDDPATRAATTAERALLAALGGGCQVPIGAWAQVQEDRLSLEAAVVAPDGRQAVRDRIAGPVSEAAALGERLARRLIAQGADRILANPPGSASAG